MNKTNLNIVEAVLDSSLRIRCHSKKLQARLKELGGRKKFFHPMIWEISFSDKNTLANLLQELRDLGFLMSGGTSGWPPSEVFKDFRSKNILQGSFKEVIWKSKDECAISDQ